MRLIFMGNPDFAVPSLRILAAANEEVVAVVTNPEKRSGRGQQVQASPVAAAAAELAIPLIQPDDLSDPDFIAQIQVLKPDLFIVVAYRILPEVLLSAPRIGAVNLHASLLPRYRGAAPIQWALINGDTKTGLTTFLIQPRVDTGDILQQAEVTIAPDDDYGSLAERMSNVGAELLAKTIRAFANGSVNQWTQDNSQATKAPKITPAMCLINWQSAAVDIRNKIRGLAPRPGAFTYLDDKRLKIFSAVINKGAERINPGSIILNQEGQLFVQTGEGLLEILECQLEGKRRMTAVEFLHGIKLKPGSILGK